MGTGSGSTSPAMPARTSSAAVCFSIESEQRLGLVDLGLRGSELNFDVLLVHIELLQAELVLSGQLVSSAL